MKISHGKIVLISVSLLPTGIICILLIISKIIPFLFYNPQYSFVYATGHGSNNVGIADDSVVITPCPYKPTPTPFPYDAKPDVQVTSHTKINTLETSFTHNSQEGSALILAAAYRASINPDARILSATYENMPLTFLRRDQYADRTTEMWYLAEPLTGGHSVNITWNNDPEDIVLNAVSVSDVDKDNIVVSHYGAGSNMQNEHQGSFMNLQVPPSSQNYILAITAAYPEGWTNIVSVDPNNGRRTHSKEYSEKNNIVGIVSGMRSENGSVMSLYQTKNFSWATSAVVLHLLDDENNNNNNKTVPLSERILEEVRQSSQCRNYYNDISLFKYDPNSNKHIELKAKDIDNLILNADLQSPDGYLIKDVIHNNDFLIYVPIVETQDKKQRISIWKNSIIQKEVPIEDIDHFKFIGWLTKSK